MKWADLGLAIAMLAVISGFSNTGTAAFPPTVTMAQANLMLAGGEKDIKEAAADKPARRKTFDDPKKTALGRSFGCLILPVLAHYLQGNRAWPLQAADGTVRVTGLPDLRRERARGERSVLFRVTEPRSDSRSLCVGARAMLRVFPSSKRRPRPAAVKPAPAARLIGFIVPGLNPNSTCKMALPGFAVCASVCRRFAWNRLLEAPKRRSPQDRYRTKPHVR